MLFRSYSIAIGTGAGYDSQANNTIVINATGGTLNASAQASSFYVDPIRSDNSATKSLVYNTTTKEITYGDRDAITSGSYSLYVANNGIVTFPTVGSDTLLMTGTQLYALAPSNILITTDAGDYTFGADGVFTMPPSVFNASPAVSVSSIKFTGNSIDKYVADNANGLLLSVGQSTADWLFHQDGNLYLPQTEQTYNKYGGIVFNWSGSGQNFTSILPVGHYTNPNITINTGSLGSSKTWTFGNDGNLYAPGSITTSGSLYAAGYNWSNGVSILSGVGSTYSNTNVSAYLSTAVINTTGNVTAPYFIGDGSKLTNVTTSVSGNLVGTSSNVTLVAGSYNWTFDNTGNLVIPTTGNITWANGTVFSSGGGGSYSNTNVTSYLLTYPNANFDTLLANNFSTANAFITGAGGIGYTRANAVSRIGNVYSNYGNFLNLTSGNIFLTGAGGIGYTAANAVSRIGNVYSTYGNFTNFSTANAVLTGGSLTGVTGAFSTLQVDNLSSGNVLISGGYISSLANATVSGNVTVGNLIGTSSNTTISAGAFTSTFNTLGNVLLPNVSVTGNVVSGGIISSGKVGYGTGSTVTQATNRGQGVTINSLAGTIVTTTATLNAGAVDVFYVGNNKVDPATDIVHVQVVSYHNATYLATALPWTVTGGGFYVFLRNIDTFNSSNEAVTIRFHVFKAPNA